VQYYALHIRAWQQHFAARFGLEHWGGYAASRRRRWRCPTTVGDRNTIAIFGGARGTVCAATIQPKRNIVAPAPISSTVSDVRY
jgi:hypothetical protein